MGEERKTCVGLGWEKNPDVHFIPSKECDIRARNQWSHDYDRTPFS